VSARRSDSGLDGILLIDKPAGWTSHDVVAKARGITGQRRIGHTGTLDPMATGLLLLCLGQATRLVEYLTGHDKRYTGVVQLGRTTTTDDAEGKTIQERPVPELTPAALAASVARFRGAISQRPPAFSALKVQGKRAYDLARAGEDVKLAERAVTIHRFDAELLAADTVVIDVVCSSGTYIRSLARDLGEAIGCGGHLTALRRESAGPFSVKDAISLDGLAQVVATRELEDRIVPADEGICELDAAILGEEGTLAMVQGRPWQGEDDALWAANPARIYGASGDFIGVGSISNLGEIRASKVLLRQKSSK
jgi:tRNA pseudouridine55 synthase